MKKFYPLHSEAINGPTLKHIWLQAKAEGYSGLAAVCETVFTKAEDQENKFHAVFSSAREDRHGDIVHQDFDLKSFKKNPVFLDSHNYFSIERIIGKVAKIGLKDGRLEGDIEFAMENPLGALAAKLADGGFLGATSIGFIPREFNDKGEMLKSELLEVSAVSVPANADALFEKAAGEQQVEEQTPAEQAPAEVQEETVPEEQAQAAEPVASPIDHKAIASRVIIDMAEKRRALIRSIARDVQELTDENRQEKKRKIYQKIRQALDA
jgi:hypothetical protein